MKRFLLTIVGLLAFAIGMNAETYTHTFKKNELTTTGGKVTLDGIDWNASSATFIDWNDEKVYNLERKQQPALLSLSAHRLSRTLQSQV